MPHDFTMRNGSPFAFAGIWEPPRGIEMPTCALITTEANTVVAEVHNRMPVILPCGRYSAWLNPDTKEDERSAMLVPFPAELMRRQAVSPRMNSPRFDEPSLLEPFAPEPPEQGDLFNSA